MGEEDSFSGFIVRPEARGDAREFEDFRVVATRGNTRLVQARRFGRFWMLKCLAEELRESTIHRKMLEKEFDLSVQLQHPHIVAVSGRENVTPYGECIVMEWIDGVTLSEWLKGHPERKKRLRVWQQILDAAGYIHSRQMVHRDLKPSNIMVTRNGENVKIIDFGLGDTDSHTSLKQPAGTPGYISPEQRETYVADARNDIYSLGKILKDLRPFRGWRQVAAKCLSPIGKRYSSVDELARDCRRRSRGFAVTAASTIALLALGLLWVFVPKNAATKETPSEPSAVNTEMQKQEDTPAAETSPAAIPAPAAEAVSPSTNKREDGVAGWETYLPKGKQQIDKIMAESGVGKRLDTLTRQIYIMPDFNKTSVRSAELIQAYSGGIEQLDGYQRQMLANALNEYANSKYLIPWGRKINSCPIDDRHLSW